MAVDPKETKAVLPGYSGQYRQKENTLIFKNSLL